jgi:hypothetical protein
MTVSDFVLDAFLTIRIHRTLLIERLWVLTVASGIDVARLDASLIYLLLEGRMKRFAKLTVFAVAGTVFTGCTPTIPVADCPYGRDQCPHLEWRVSSELTCVQTKSGDIITTSTGEKVPQTNGEYQVDASKPFSVEFIAQDPAGIASIDLVGLPDLQCQKRVSSCPGPGVVADPNRPTFDVTDRYTTDHLNTTQTLHDGGSLNPVKTTAIAQLRFEKVDKSADSAVIRCNDTPSLLPGDGGQHYRDAWAGSIVITGSATEVQATQAKQGAIRIRLVGPSAAPSNPPSQDWKACPGFYTSMDCKSP